MVSFLRPRSWRGTLFPPPLEHLLLLATAAHPRLTGGASTQTTAAAADGQRHRKAHPKGSRSSSSSLSSFSPPSPSSLPPYWLTAHQLALMRARIRRDAKPVHVPKYRLSMVPSAPPAPPPGSVPPDDDAKGSAAITPQHNNHHHGGGREGSVSSLLLMEGDGACPEEGGAGAISEGEGEGYDALQIGGESLAAEASFSGGFFGCPPPPLPPPHQSCIALSDRDAHTYYCLADVVDPLMVLGKISRARSRLYKASSSSSPALGAALSSSRQRMAGRRGCDGQPDVATPSACISSGSNLQRMHADEVACQQGGTAHHGHEHDSHADGGDVGSGEALWVAPYGPETVAKAHAVFTNAELRRGGSSSPSSLSHLHFSSSLYGVGGGAGSGLARVKEAAHALSDCRPHCMLTLAECFGREGGAGGGVLAGHSPLPSASPSTPFTLSPSLPTQFRHDGLPFSLEDQRVLHCYLERKFAHEPWAFLDDADEGGGTAINAANSVGTGLSSSSPLHVSSPASSSPAAAAATRRRIMAWPPLWITLEAASRLLPFKPIPDAGDFSSSPPPPSSAFGVGAEMETARYLAPMGTPSSEGPTEPGVILKEWRYVLTDDGDDLMGGVMCGGTAAAGGGGVEGRWEEVEVRWYHSSSFPIPTPLSALQQEEGEGADMMPSSPSSADGGEDYNGSADDSNGAGGSGGERRNRSGGEGEGGGPILARGRSHFLVDPITGVLLQGVIGADGALRVVASSSTHHHQSDADTDLDVEGVGAPCEGSHLTGGDGHHHHLRHAADDGIGELIRSDGWEAVGALAAVHAAQRRSVHDVAVRHGPLVGRIVRDALLGVDGEGDGVGDGRSATHALVGSGEEPSFARASSSDSSSSVSDGVGARVGGVDGSHLFCLEPPMPTSFLSKGLCRPLPMLSVRTGLPIPCFVGHDHHYNHHCHHSHGHCDGGGAAGTAADDRNGMPSPVAIRVAHPLREWAALEARRYCHLHRVYCGVWGTRRDYGAMGLRLVEGGPIGLRIPKEVLAGAATGAAAAPYSCTAPPRGAAADGHSDGEGLHRLSVPQPLPSSALAALGAGEEGELEGTADAGEADGSGGPHHDDDADADEGFVEYFPAFMCTDVIGALRCGYARRRVVAMYNGELSALAFGEDGGRCAGVG